ncbi:MAG: DUF2115 domain-containing protein [Methanobrevibacter sp.]|nr:DUF2115 domain-containing protein [Candidatus Methanovirga basalitermitum]
MDQKDYEATFKMFDKVKKMDKIEKVDFTDMIRSLSKNITVHDLSVATAVLRESGKYVQENYREKYLEIYIKYFIMRLKDINEDKNRHDNDYVDVDRIRESLDILKFQMDMEEHPNDKFPLIYVLISLYTTYILEQPIHPVGTPFPGNLHVTYKDGIFYCPVKRNNENNPKAVCKFCLAEQTELD